MLSSKTLKWRCVFDSVWKWNKQEGEQWEVRSGRQREDRLCGIIQIMMKNVTIILSDMRSHGGRGENLHILER